MTPCYCQSGQAFKDCCQPILKGQFRPRKAEQLMRARFCAHRLSDLEFIVRTSTPEQQQNLDMAALPDFCGDQWQSLEVIQTKQGLKRAYVEFKAYFLHQQQLHCHHEYSEFRFIKQQWLFHAALENNPFSQHGST